MSLSTGHDKPLSHTNSRLFTLSGYLYCFAGKVGRAPRSQIIVSPWMLIALYEKLVFFFFFKYVLTISNHRNKPRLNEAAYRQKGGRCPSDRGEPHQQLSVHPQPRVSGGVAMNARSRNPSLRRCCLRRSRKPVGADSASSTYTCRLTLHDSGAHLNRLQRHVVSRGRTNFSGWMAQCPWARADRGRGGEGEKEKGGGGGGASENVFLFVFFLSPNSLPKSAALWSGPLLAPKNNISCLPIRETDKSWQIVYAW